MKHVNDINTCLFYVNDYKNCLKHLNIITFTYCPELKRDEKELRNGYWFFKEEKHIKIEQYSSIWKSISFMVSLEEGYCKHYVW